MYRSNDVVQFYDDSIFIRPFVKVGEPPETVKVLQYFVKKTEIEDEESNGPNGNGKSKIQKVGEFFKNIFRSHKFSTKRYHKYSKGEIEEVEFATVEWETR